METPQFLNSTYATSNASGYSFGHEAGAQLLRPMHAAQLASHVPALKPQPKAAIAAKETVMTATRRMVRVVIVDPNENVPVESGLLHDSKELFTDKTDQELFFDTPIVELLKSHNAKRATLVNKAVKDRTEYLEPARIRDLKMLVIELATF